MLYTLHITKYFLDQTDSYEIRVVSELYYYIYLLPKNILYSLFWLLPKKIFIVLFRKLIVRHILPIDKKKRHILPILIIHRYVSAEISIAVSPYEPVTSYISGRFFAFHNKYEMLKSLPSYTEYHRRLNLATGFLFFKVFLTCSVYQSIVRLFPQQKVKKNSTFVFAPKKRIVCLL